VHILCDTCSILMLIRIAPNMFTDKRYECCTLTQVRQELLGTHKFKSKYPWRSDYKDKIKCLPNSNFSNNKPYETILDTINLLTTNDIASDQTGRRFDLSRVDRELLASSLSSKFVISTGDSELKEFAEQEFYEIYKGSISPLGLINKWIRLGIIKWNKTRHQYVSDWNLLHEDPQPKKQKALFKKLTGLKYPGS